MWYVQYLIFIGLGVFFLVLSLWKENNPFWNLACSFISSMIWLIISLAQMQIEFPYSFDIGQGEIICGSCTYTDPLSPYFTYFFFGLFVILQIYVWMMVLDKWYFSEYSK